MVLTITINGYNIIAEGVAFLKFTGCLEQLTVILNLNKLEKKLEKKTVSRKFRTFPREYFKSIPIVCRYRRHIQVEY